MWQSFLDFTLYIFFCFFRPIDDLIRAWFLSLINDSDSACERQGSSDSAKDSPFTDSLPQVKEKNHQTSSNRDTCSSELQTLVANPTKEVHLPSDNTRPRRRNVR
jgi:hypothetical protein